jgi:hypothetical protein
VVRFASEIESPRANALGRSYFESLRKDPTQSLVFSEVAVGRMAGRQQLYMATPIRDAHGGFAGVAMAPLELNYVQALFDAVDLGPGGVITFRRSDDGRLVLRRPAQPDRVNRTLSNNPMHMRIEAGEREGTIRYEAAIDQVERVYAYKRVGNYPFTPPPGSPPATTWPTGSAMPCGRWGRRPCSCVRWARCCGACISQTAGAACGPGPAGQ